MDFVTGTWKSQLDLTVDMDHARQFDIYGIVGTIDLFSGKYVIVITKRRHVGKIVEHAVYRLDKVAILPLDAMRAADVMDMLRAKRASMDVRPGESSEGSSTVDTSDDEQEQPVEREDAEEEENFAQVAAGLMKNVQSAIVDLAKWSPSDTVRMAARLFLLYNWCRNSRPK
jgi:hypothetical protein